MGNNGEFRLKCGRGRIDQFDGYFFVDGGGTVNNAVDTATGVTALNTATGKFTVTFPYSFEKVYSYVAELNAISASNTNFAQVDSFNPNLNGKAVMVIGTYATASAANTTGSITWSVTARR